MKSRPRPTEPVSPRRSGPPPRFDAVAALADADDETVARRIASQWRIAAIGRRTVDHVGRDLLFGSLGRDYRAWPYRLILKEPPPWREFSGPGYGDDPAEVVDDRTGEVADFLGRTVVQRHLALRLAHAKFLARLARPGEVPLEPAQEGLVSRLYQCRPVGLLFAEPGRRSPGDGRVFRCWRGRACPWCHARKAVRLYQRLLAGPCDPDRAGNQLLVMAKVCVSDAPVDGVDPEVLTPERVARVHGVWRPLLLDLARRLGMAGGLVAHQVGPALVGDRRAEWWRTFRHDLAVLGEVPLGPGGGFDPATRDRVWRLAGFADAAGPQPELVDVATGGGVPVEVSAMRRADGKALRWLLAGSPAHRRWGDVAHARIERNEAARPGGGGAILRQNLGVDGALALQPTFLMTPLQFWSYVRAMGGRHLYSPFGSWREALRDPRRAGHPRGAEPAAGGAPRRDRADAALRHLVEVARPLYDDLTRALGRPPGRKVLADALADAGQDVPRRRVVALVRALGASPASGPG